MRTITLKIPEFGFIVATRAALAFGAGLLASAKIPDRPRKIIGVTLLMIGAASTVPAMMTVRRHITDAIG